MQDASPAEYADLGLESLAPAELESGVWRIPAPLSFGARATNLYLLRGEAATSGWCLIDCPLATWRAEAALRSALDRIGITPRDITAIVLTHAHPDHMGAAGRWQRLTERRTGGAGKQSVLTMLLRLGLLILAAYPIITYLEVNPAAVFLGLLTSAAAVIFSIVFELIYGT